MATKRKVRRGDVVRFLPEFQDSGDSAYQFVAVEDEDGGRVLVEAQLGLPFNPQQVVLVSWLAGLAEGNV